MSVPNILGRGLTPVVLVAILSGCLPQTHDWPQLEPSVEAPGFTLPQLAGGTVSLSDHRGRVVIMEFWATWCAPCRFSSPSLDAIYRKYQNRGVSVFLINEGETAEQIRDWAGRRFAAPILLDRDGAVGQRYGVSALPRLFVIDQAGTVLYVRSGYQGGLVHELSLILKELLARQPVGRHD